MRYLFGFASAFALSLMLSLGCSEGGGEGGSGGTAGTGGTGGMPECKGPEDCDDDDECSVDTCIEGVCRHLPAEDSTFCADDSGRCIAGSCWLISCEGLENGVACFVCGLGTGGACDFGFCLDGACALGTTCEVDADCNDYKDCTSDSCHDVGICEFAPVRDGTPCAGGSCQGGECVIESSVLPCTEEGIRAAVAQGDGPYTFECDGPTSVVTATEIIIGRNVILDGEGNLTVDGDQDHRVFRVTRDVTVELRGFEITNGPQGIYNEGTLTLTDSTVSGNHGLFLGGGIYNQGTLALENSVVSDNSHGGVFNVGGTLTVSHSTISANGNSYTSGYVPALAGGIHNGGGTLSLTDSTVSGNDSHGVGGGISNSGDGMVTVINSTVSGNTAVCGGGIFSLDGLVTLTHSTVSGNAAIDGSGICNGEFWFGQPGGPVEITNTLLDGECASVTTPLSGGHNIESPGNTCGFDTNKGDLFDVTVEQLTLGPPRDNGGPTMTHALLPGSVAVDRIPSEDCVDVEGAALTTDQRGVSRPQGDSCDVGAFELEQ